MVRAALLAITPRTGMVRRYTRNPHGKVWLTHESVIEEGYLNADAVEVLNDFLKQPTQFPLAQPLEAA